MSPLLLRRLWALIEATQSSILLSLDDGHLVSWLLRQLKTERSLDSHETYLLKDYIHSKLSLIRDLAEERLSARFD